MLAVCSAFAYAVEPSLSTFSATAALIGAATLALISDMAARSGSGSPASSSSCSRVSFWCSVIWSLLTLALVDGRVLRGVRVRDRPVGQHVRCHGGVDRDRDVRVHERHRGPLRQRLAGELVELLARQLPVALFRHVSSFAWVR